MNTDQATVTIPYKEFEAHQKQVERIEWANQMQSKLDRGEFFTEKAMQEIADKLIAFGRLFAESVKPFSPMEAPVEPYRFLERLGYKVSFTTRRGEDRDFAILSKIE